MNLSRTPFAGHSRKHVVLSTLIAVVAAVAMLLGLLAMHSAGTGSAASEPLPATTASAHGGHDGSPGLQETVAVAGLATVAAITHAHDGLVTCGENCLVDCALMAMMCVVLLVLASIVVLASRPALYRRLLDAGGRTVLSLFRTPSGIHRPNLTVLSISRT